MSLSETLTSTLGSDSWSADSERIAAHLEEPRGLWHGKCQLVVWPRSTEEVAKAVRACAESGTPIVPQGGMTGLVGGAIPDDSNAVAISLKRMNKVRQIDPADYTMVAEAGCTLLELQNAARDVNRLFPLSLAAEGTCTIGGNLATNAGGNTTLRYGNAREMVLGLEVVTATGEIWNGLRKLRKDNTGYDLKHLFIGAEGTLGIITAASLKLFTLPRHTQTALIAVASPAKAIELLGVLRDCTGDAVSAFELMERRCVDFVVKHESSIKDPFAERYPWYVVTNIASGRPVQEEVETALGEAFEQELVLDAVISQNEAQAKSLWAIRETIPLVQKLEGVSIKHDISVPVSRVAEFLDVATKACAAEIPDVRVCAFGHAGDGNMHFNVSEPVGHPDFLSYYPVLNKIVHDITVSMGGSISAEHGIGVAKKAELATRKRGVEMEMMRAIKKALDPAGIMNPGKVL
ncbi:MAG: FAD-binding oxidoreductase [Rhodospirillales bacterium]